MKAIGYSEAGAISARNALIKFETDTPHPGPHDLLVEVRGVSVNPVDVKLRAGVQPEDGPRILGFDAAGVVKAVGSAVTDFQPGDEVFYASDITRPGTNATLHVVDHGLWAVSPHPSVSRKQRAYP